jgi:hypothetical protein
MKNAMDPGSSSLYFHSYPAVFLLQSILKISKDLYVFIDFEIEAENM